jgi:hypothetical protein
MSQELNQVNGNQVTSDSKPITALEAMEALNILKCQVGNARLRKMWSEPIKQYILQGLEDAEECPDPDEGR